jgi:hypothetical protein
VLADDHLGGDLARTMRTSMGAFSERFIRNLFTRLDSNGDGDFDFNEFAAAFSPVIDDNGECVPQPHKLFNNGMILNSALCGAHLLL